MHPLQTKILDLATSRNLALMSYREIGRLIDEEHPQKVKHHLQQLERAGLLSKSRDGTELRKSSLDSGIQAIPIRGSANCGPASLLADDNIEGYLRISTRIVAPRKGLFALRAVGDSMNRAAVKGKQIEDGDFVLVDPLRRSPRTNEIVVSVIDSLANIKKIVIDNANERVVLTSVSTNEYPPILIHPDETAYYICGTVVDVVKNVRP